MLDRMAGFNDTLRAEVERATAELRAANRELTETAQRLFAARRELARSQRLALAGQMAASVAHQVGTPLNVISGYVQMLRAKHEDGSPDAARLRTIQEQIARVTAHRAVAARPHAARRRLALRPLAPGELVEGLAELVRPVARRAAASSSSVEVAPGLPRGGRRPGPARAGAAEPGQQRGRRHARGRPAVARRPAGRGRRRARRDGLGRRDPARGPRAGVRSALHDQAAGEGHRPRPAHPARDRRGPRRNGAPREPAGRGHDAPSVRLPRAAEGG